MLCCTRLSVSGAIEPFVAAMYSCRRRTAKALKVLAALSACLLFSAAHAGDPGVYPDRIVFGQTAPLSGFTEQIGSSLRIGINVAFEEINRNGGIGDRLLVLKSRDDQYIPDLARSNTIDLIENEQIFALVGVAGTPTAQASVSIAVEHNVPFIAPLSGAEVFRDKQRLPNVVNLRPSYAQETEAWIDYLVSAGIDRIAVFYQDDAFGRSGLRGVRNSLSERGMLTVARGSFSRNRTVLSTAVFDIRRAEPAAVAMISTYRTSAEFIRQIHDLGLRPQFLNLSILGSDAFVTELGDDSEGVIVSQVMPSPWDTSIPLVREYRDAMSKYAGLFDTNEFATAPELNGRSSSESAVNFTSLEGYVTGRFIISILREIKGDPTREKLLSKIYDKAQFDIGGLKFDFTAGSNQGLHDVYLTALDRDHRFQSIYVAHIPASHNDH